MDWRSSDRLDDFRFTRVSRATLEDIDELGNIKPGGSVSRNSLTALKASGSLDYEGALDLGNDLLRVYSISTAGGRTETVVHGTFLASTPEATVRVSVHDEDGGLATYVTTSTGTAQLYSLLLLLQRRRIALPLTVPAGTAAVAYAADMARSVGLSVVADASSAQLTLPKAFDGGLTLLEVINELLLFAGFRSLGVDGMGNALMRAYRDPSSLSPSVVWSHGDGSTHATEVEHAFDWFDVPNRLQVTCSRPEQPPLIAVAVNDDPANRYSTVSRGEVIDAEPEEVDDIAGQSALDALARSRLIDKTSAVESLRVRHSWEPYDLDDGCLVVHGDLVFSGVVVSDETELARGMITDTRVRRFVRM